MALARLTDIKLSLGGTQVLDGVSLGVEPGDRIGLIGVNGCGKTTLLRVIAGAIEPASGRVERGRRLRIGFMEQEPELSPQDNAHGAALAAFADLTELEQHMREVEHEIASSEGARRTNRLKRLGQLQTRFEHAGGYERENRAAASLMGLGFSREEFTRPVSVLSGGERSRLALARLLLRESDLLLLDEPTNHLDINGIEWLEDFLSKKYRGAVVLVSHDRTFLDRTVGRIVELDRGRLTAYRGNYSKFVELENLKRLEQQRRYDEQQEFIHKEEEFIRRYHAAQRGREARGRRKRLDRLERIEAPTRDKKISVSFDPIKESGEVCMRVESVSKSYGARLLFDGLEFEIYRGERVGIVGPNGSGKTTLLRILLGLEEPNGGSCRRGHNVLFGYLEQHPADLASDRTVLDEVWERNRKLDEVEVRYILGRFLFSGDEAVLKKTRDLSGGERTRLALARLMVERPNFLMLDEPTNHLDIPSRIALEAALLAYTGTLVVVSHDRYFLNRVARKLIVLEGGGRVIPGNYEHYEYLKAEAQEVAPPPDTSKPIPVARRTSRPRISKNRLAQMENEISRLEREKQTLEAALARPELYTDPQKARDLPRRYQKLCTELDERYHTWIEQETEESD